MPNLSLTAYKLDEAAPVKAYTLTKAQDDVAVAYEAGLCARSNKTASDFMDAIFEHGGEKASVLDLGCSYGAQKVAQESLYPKMTWAGVEVGSQYEAKVKGRWPNSQIFLVDSFTDMSVIKDGSYDIVTSRSALCHYSHENAFKVINEMIRIARKAVIIKLYVEIIWTPEYAAQCGVSLDANGDVFQPITGRKAGTGYFVEWSLPAWEKYISDKVVTHFRDNPLVVVICPQQP